MSEENPRGMTELERALLVRVEQLEAYVRSARGVSAPLVSNPEDFRPAPPPPHPNIDLHTLQGSQGLPGDPRTIRQLAEAVALCMGAPSPAHEIPKAWVPPLRTLHAARAKGLPWRAALKEAGLEAPSDLGAEAQAVRDAVPRLWDALLPSVGRVHAGTTSHLQEDLVGKLRRLLE